MNKAAHQTSRLSLKTFSPESGQHGLADDTNSLLWISLHLQVCLWDLSKWALCGVFLDPVQFFFLGLLVCRFCLVSPQLRGLCP